MLMSRSSKTPPVSQSTELATKRKSRTGSDLRDGLLAYALDPAAFSSRQVIRYDDSWVVVGDLYPKSSIHVLLIPRDRTKVVLHPFEAFKDAEFLAAAKAEVASVRLMMASELRQKYGKFSATEEARYGAMNADELVAEASLPAGRDWSKDVMSGVHASPSMNHLHIHVLSVDRYSPCLRHRKHYNSFNTRFLVPLDDFPLPATDLRWHPARQRYLDHDMLCWKCGKDFGNQFLKLKEHLRDEFDVWKAE